jgi:hypothetical protein
MRVIASIFAAGAICASGVAQSVLFDFDSAPLHSPFPIDVTAGGITAHLSAGYYNYSIQRADALGWTPAGFGGYCLYPNTVYREDLLIGFSMPLKDFSILYAPEEYDCDSSCTMRVTSYMDAAYVGTDTATTYAGTWPTGTLSLSSPTPFNRVVVHYDAPPPTGGDWGPIFLADNMIVTPVPEPASLAGVLLGLGTVFQCLRRR